MLLGSAYVRNKKPFYRIPHHSYFTSKGVIPLEGVSDAFLVEVYSILLNITVPKFTNDIRFYLD